MTKSPLYFLSLVLRGMAMGAADVVPGVSGGTIAFITGIYDELIGSLRRCDHRALGCLFQQGPVAAWQYINGSFLLAVFSGIFISVFTLANVVHHLLAAAPILVWSFFFGLIMASSLHLARQLESWNVARMSLLLLGVALAVAVSLLKPAQLPSDWWVLTLAGAVAICAMLLPGVSGGFLLLMMGLYSTIIGAVVDFNVVILVSFALGCGMGLLAFSHVLGWLLERFHNGTMALLTGFLLGSLNVIWPWKEVLENITNRHGELVPVVQRNIVPHTFEQLTGEPSMWFLALLACCSGVVLVMLTEYLGSKSTQ